VVAIERKLGLGECIFLVNATARGAEVLPEVFHSIDTIYHSSPTYGKYSGFLAYSLYSLSSATITDRILEELRKFELISDFFIFHIIDFDVKLADYRDFDPTLGWAWNWSEWRDQIPKTLKSKKKFTLSMDEVQSLVDFDTIDVLILKHLFDDGDITQRKLAEVLSLSETQVNKRIRRLEDAGIIKGYRSEVSTSDNEMSIICFLILENPQDQILSVFYQLPFPAIITMNSRTRFAIQLSLNSQDMTGFLRGLDVLRPHLASCFVQTIHDARMSMDSHPYDLYNEKTNRWETPESAYLQDIQNVMGRK
jgi:DNA-binding Lrp family transcriptional regulator